LFVDLGKSQRNW